MLVKLVVEGEFFVGYNIPARKDADPQLPSNNPLRDVSHELTISELDMMS
jgi:hypothetical protein